MNPARRCRRTLLLGFASLITLAMTACGGNADDNYESADLYGAYEAIEWGMSIQLVKAIVGAEPVGQTTDGLDYTLYRWETDKGTYLYTTLLVQVDGDLGVVGKIITGPNGNESETLGPLQ